MVVPNLNVGLLGHVDSGKTSLARALSRVASTAAFDKSPQSQSRGITLDLGFSACNITLDDKECRAMLEQAGLDSVQCTLVDCPGHASLIRTVLGGAQIIDVMVLVVDATKGIQTQTAECIVIGEVLATPLVVVINKVDAVQGNSEEEKEAYLTKLRKKLATTFAQTRWPSVEMVEVSAAPKANSAARPVNTAAVLPAMLSLVDLTQCKKRWEKREERASDFLMLVDHCFSVRGQGTIFTGTVIGGVVRVGDNVLLPELQVVKKVKGLQIFKQAVTEARQGDRVGVSVASFDPTQMERGVLCYAGGDAKTASEVPERVPESISVLVAEVQRIRYHPFSCDSHTKFHVTLGHSTVMATMRYFSRPAAPAGEKQDQSFNLEKEGAYIDELPEDSFLLFDTDSGVSPSLRGHAAPIKRHDTIYYAIVLLEQPIFAFVGATFVAMRLDVEREGICRIALTGRVKALIRGGKPFGGSAASLHVEPAWRSLPIVRMKRKVLHVDRVVDERTCIVTGVVSSERHGKVSTSTGGESLSKEAKDVMHAESHKFVGLKVVFEPVREETTADVQDHVPGVIDCTFGKTGKVKVIFEKPVFSDPALSVRDQVRRKKKKDGEDEVSQSENASSFLCSGEIVLTLKKYPLATHTSITQ